MLSFRSAVRILSRWAATRDAVLKHRITRAERTSAGVDEDANESVAADASSI